MIKLLKVIITAPIIVPHELCHYYTARAFGLRATLLWPKEAKVRVEARVTPIQRFILATAPLLASLIFIPPAWLSSQAGAWAWALTWGYLALIWQVSCGFIGLSEL